MLTVDGGWSSWSAYTPCTKKCGGGVKTRHRTCTNPTPAYEGKDCTGEISQEKRCNKQKCPGMTGGFTVGVHFGCVV